MTTREAASQLAQLIDVDIEDAEKTVTAERPSSQYRLLLESIRQLIAKEATNDDAIKLLGIAQAILSGSYRFLDEPEAIKRFEELLAFSVTEPSPEIKDRAFTVAALLLNRVREPQKYMSQPTFALIEKGLRDTSPLQRSVLSAIRRRIKAATERRRETRSQTPRKFDVPDLDVPNAAKNVREDVGGDWYQDPWGWPEVEWLGRTRKKVVDRLRNDLCGWTLPIDVSKRGGGVRPGMVINPLDRVAFQSLVDDISIEAAGHLPSWVHGWRLTRRRQRKGTYETNKSEWKLFSRRVAALCKQFRFTAHLDIQAFFPTVDTSRLLAQLGRRYRNAAVLDRLETYFEAWHRCPNGWGIPQRSLASSVLAHAVLRPLDIFLDQKSGGGDSRSFLATRWMDDIWLHSDDEEDLRSSVTEIESVLAQLRLSLNSEKTAIFESKDAGRFVQLVDDYEDEEVDPNITLRQLLERTERAEDAPAFQVGLEVSKILSSKKFSSLAEISSGGFVQFNYVADRLAKLLRASGEWKRLTSTYVELARSRVSGENLSVAAWAEMFPNRPEDGIEEVQQFFSKNLVDSLQRLVAPLAAQRLAAWSSRFGVGNLPEIDLLKILQGDGGLLRLRGIGFAALTIDSLKEKILAALAQTGDDVIEGFLKDRNFEAPSLSTRFLSE